MKMHRSAVQVLGAVALGSMLSCTSPSMAPRHAATPEAAAKPAGLDTTYAALAAQGGHVFALNPGESAVRIFAFRAGQAARVGHNHVLSAPKFTGYFYLPPAGAASGRFDLEFRLDELEIDRPELRATYGPAFASVLNTAAIQGTRDHMLGSDNLEADRFPFVRVHSAQIAGETPKFAARVEVELHGQKREMTIPLDVTGLPGSLHVGGSFVLRQTDFGAKPYSVLGGLIAVQDEVVVEFALAAR
ncbi:MAG: YceI family protein [Caldimonas sp.]